MSLDRIISKTSLALIGLIALSVFISGCAVPVCCGPKPDEPQFQTKLFEIQRRLSVIDLFLEYQSQQDFNKMASLFTKDSRDKMKLSSVKLKRKRSPEELNNHMRDMDKFIFFNEKETTHKNKPMWVLSYQHSERKHQFLIYYLMQEGRAYKIYQQRPLTKH